MRVFGAMIRALRDDSSLSSRNRESRAISLAQRTPARLMEDQCEVHDLVRDSGQLAVKKFDTRAIKCHIAEYSNTRARRRGRRSGKVREPTSKCPQ
jgi:hypothetical protein